MRSGSSTLGAQYTASVTKFSKEVTRIVGAGFRPKDVIARNGKAWLDKAIKFLLGTMALLTLTATVLVLPDLDFSTFSLGLPEAARDVAAIGFVVALAGWMPAPMDISVWNSLWALAKRETLKSNGEIWQQLSSGFAEPAGLRYWPIPKNIR